MRLDVGCGLNKFADDCLGFDIESSIKPDVVGDAHYLPFKKDAFKAIYCRGVIEHMVNPAQVIKEMTRIGKVVHIITLNDQYWRRFLYGESYPEHIAAWNKDHMVYLLRKLGLKHSVKVYSEQEELKLKMGFVDRIFGRLFSRQACKWIHVIIQNGDAYSW